MELLNIPFVLLEALRWLPLMTGEGQGLLVRWRVPLSPVGSGWAPEQRQGVQVQMRSLPIREGPGGLHGSASRVPSRSGEDSGTEWKQRFGTGIPRHKASWEEERT